MKKANLFSEAKQRVKLKDRFGAEMGEAFAGFGGDDDLEAAGRFRFSDSGFRVQVFGFRVWGMGCGVQDRRFEDLGLRV